MEETAGVHKGGAEWVQHPAERWTHQTFALTRPKGDQASDQDCHDEMFFWISENNDVGT